MKVSLIIALIFLLFCPGCTGNPAIRPSEPIGSTAVPATGESNIPSNDIRALREEYFEFGIENRLDYVPLFDEGKAPSSSAEYLFYAFAINLDNWGEDKGTMTRDYVEQVIRTHFEVENVTHTSLRKGWNYDGGKYTAFPQDLKEKPIYVLRDFNTYTQNGRTVYEITLDDCSYDGVPPTDEDMANLRANIVSGDLSLLTVRQTECFKYYLNQTTGAVVFLSHTIGKDNSLTETAANQSAETTDWEPTAYATVNNLNSVTMTVKGETVSPNGLAVGFVNNSGSQYIYGAFFCLEKKINGAWYKVPVVIDGNYGFNDIAYILALGDDGQWAINWDWLYGSLDPGEYRIVKDVLDSRSLGDYTTYYLAAEFTVYKS